MGVVRPLLLLLLNFKDLEKKKNRCMLIPHPPLVSSPCDITNGLDWGFSGKAAEVTNFSPLLNCFHKTLIFVEGSLVQNAPFSHFPRVCCFLVSIQTSARVSSGCCKICSTSRCSGFSRWGPSCRFSGFFHSRSRPSCSITDPRWICCS